MKHSRLLLLVVFVTAILLLSQPNTALLNNPNTGVVPKYSEFQTAGQAQPKILEGYGKLPLIFEANKGQTDSRVKFLSRTGGYTLFLTGDEAVFALRGSNPKHAASSEGEEKYAAPSKERTTGAVLRMKLRNANR